MQTKINYVTTSAGWLDGLWREKGETVSMTARAAEHLVASGQLALAKAGAGGAADNDKPAPKAGVSKVAG